MSNFHLAAGASAGVVALACSAAPTWAGITAFNAAVTTVLEPQGNTVSASDTAAGFGAVNARAATTLAVPGSPTQAGGTLTGVTNLLGTVSGDGLLLDFDTTESNGTAQSGAITYGGIGSVLAGATIVVDAATPFTLTGPQIAAADGLQRTSGAITLGRAGEAPLVDASFTSGGFFYNAPDGVDPRLTTVAGVLQPGTYNFSYNVVSDGELTVFTDFNGLSLTVPEPASAALILPAGLALLKRRRRRA